VEFGPGRGDGGKGAGQELPGQHGKLRRVTGVGRVRQGGRVHVRHHHCPRPVQKGRRVLRLRQPGTDAKLSTADGARTGATRLEVCGAAAVAVEHEIAGKNDDAAVRDAGKRP
jgi:hypothetical protein